MGSTTLTLLDEVKAELKTFCWVNWSEVAKDELIKRTELQEKFEKVRSIVSKSKFTEKDADELANKIKKSMHESLKNEGLI